MGYPAPTWNQSQHDFKHHHTGNQLACKIKNRTSEIRDTGGAWCQLITVTKVLGMERLPKRLPDEATKRGKMPT